METLTLQSHLVSLRNIWSFWCSQQFRFGFSWFVLSPWNFTLNNVFFSAPEPKAQVHYCDHALSVVRLSVCPSLTFHIFDFFSETAEQNSTKQDLNVLYKVCVFRADRKNKMAAWPLIGWDIGWDIFDFSYETAERNSTKLDRQQDLNVLYQVCVFQADRKKQDGRPGLWLAETFSTSHLKLLNGIQLNLTGSKISTSSTKFVFFGLIGKTRWPPWPLIGWDIFHFSYETAERNSTKLDRKQDLNVFYHLASCQV